MTANELLILVRQRLGDMQKVALSDEELIMSLNVAIDRLSEEMAIDHNPEFIKTFTVTNAEKVVRPKDYISLCGQFPLLFSQEVDGVKAYHENPDFEGSMIVRYFASRPHVVNLTDTIPFDKTLQHRQLVTYTVYDVKSVKGEVPIDDSKAING